MSKRASDFDADGGGGGNKRRRGGGGGFGSSSSSGGVTQEDLTEKLKSVNAEIAPKSTMVQQREDVYNYFPYFMPAAAFSGNFPDFKIGREIPGIKSLYLMPWFLEFLKQALCNNINGSTISDEAMKRFDQSLLASDFVRIEVEHDGKGAAEMGLALPDDFFEITEGNNNNNINDENDGAGAGAATPAAQGGRGGGGRQAKKPKKIIHCGSYFAKLKHDGEGGGGGGYLLEKKVEILIEHIFKKVPGELDSVEHAFSPENVKGYLLIVLINDPKFELTRAFKHSVNKNAMAVIRAQEACSNVVEKSVKTNFSNIHNILGSSHGIGSGGGGGGGSGSALDVNGGGFQKIAGSDVLSSRNHLHTANGLVKSIISYISNVLGIDLLDTVFPHNELVDQITNPLLRECIETMVNTSVEVNFANREPFRVKPEHETLMGKSTVNHDLNTRFYDVDALWKSPALWRAIFERFDCDPNYYTDLSSFISLSERGTYVYRSVCKEGCYTLDAKNMFRTMAPHIMLSKFFASKTPFQSKLGASASAVGVGVGGTSTTIISRVSPVLSDMSKLRDVQNDSLSEITLGKISENAPTYVNGANVSKYQPHEICAIVPRGLLTEIKWNVFPTNLKACVGVSSDPLLTKEEKAIKMASYLLLPSKMRYSVNRNAEEDFNSKLPLMHPTIVKAVTSSDTNDGPAIPKIMSFKKLGWIGNFMANFSSDIGFFVKLGPGVQLVWYQVMAALSLFNISLKNKDVSNTTRTIIAQGPPACGKSTATGETENLLGDLGIFKDFGGMSNKATQYGGIPDFSCLVAHELPITLFDPLNPIHDVLKGLLTEGKIAYATVAKNEETGMNELQNIQRVVRSLFLGNTNNQLNPDNPLCTRAVLLNMAHLWELHSPGVIDKLANAPRGDSEIKQLQITRDFWRQLHRQVVVAQVMWYETDVPLPDMALVAEVLSKIRGKFPTISGASGGVRLDKSHMLHASTAQQTAGIISLFGSAGPFQCMHVDGGTGKFVIVEQSSSTSHGGFLTPYMFPSVETLMVAIASKMGWDYHMLSSVLRCIAGSLGFSADMLRYLVLYSDAVKGVFDTESRPLRERLDEFPPSRRIYFGTHKMPVSHDVPRNVNIVEGTNCKMQLQTVPENRSGADELRSISGVINITTLFTIFKNAVGGVRDLLREAKTESENCGTLVDKDWRKIGDAAEKMHGAYSACMKPDILSMTKVIISSELFVNRVIFEDMKTEIERTVTVLAMPIIKGIVSNVHVHGDDDDDKKVAEEVRKALGAVQCLVLILGDIINRLNTFKMTLEQKRLIGIGNANYYLSGKRVHHTNGELFTYYPPSIDLDGGKRPIPIPLKNRSDLTKFKFIPSANKPGYYDPNYLLFKTAPGKGLIDTVLEIMHISGNIDGDKSPGWVNRKVLGAILAKLLITGGGLRLDTHRLPDIPVSSMTYYELGCMFHPDNIKRGSKQVQLPVLITLKGDDGNATNTEFNEFMNVELNAYNPEDDKGDSADVPLHPSSSSSSSSSSNRRRSAPPPSTSRSRGLNDRNGNGNGNGNGSFNQNNGNGSSGAGTGGTGDNTTSFGLSIHAVMLLCNVEDLFAELCHISLPPDCPPMNVLIPAPNSGNATFFIPMKIGRGSNTDDGVNQNFMSSKMREAYSKTKKGFPLDENHYKKNFNQDGKEKGTLIDTANRFLKRNGYPPGCISDEQVQNMMNYVMDLQETAKKCLLEYPEDIGDSIAHYYPDVKK